MDVLLGCLLDGVMLTVDSDKTSPAALMAAALDMMVPEDEIARRREKLAAAGARLAPASQTLWQATQRLLIGQFGTGAVPENAVKFRRIAQHGLRRDSH